MKATLVFESHESSDISIGMVFIPCLCWKVGRTRISNPHPDYPDYRKGDFQELLKLPALDYVGEKGSTRVVVVTQDAGHGRLEDIELLLEDIREAGFSFKRVDL